MSRGDKLKEFAGSLPFTFKDPALLRTVFVHRSYLNEIGLNEIGLNEPGLNEGEAVVSNERLEFLGDSVLQVVVSRMLFDKFPGLPEGELTRLRARLVNRLALSRIAEELGLGELMLLGRGERLSGGAKNPAMLSDTLEALFGAIYLDSGFEGAFVFMEGLFSPLMDETLLRDTHFDYKPRLQELVQAHFKTAPEYRVISEEGPPHKKSFTVEAVVGGESLGKGTAPRKKDAEQIAAGAAMEKLRERGITLDGSGADGPGPKKDKDKDAEGA